MNYSKDKDRQHQNQAWIFVRGWGAQILGARSPK